MKVSLKYLKKLIKEEVGKLVENYDNDLFDDTNYRTYPDNKLVNIDDGARINLNEFKVRYPKLYSHLYNDLITYYSNLFDHDQSITNQKDYISNIDFWLSPINNYRFEPFLDENYVEVEPGFALLVKDLNDNYGVDMVWTHNHEYPFAA